MGFVSVVATKDYLNVLSDGLHTQDQKDGEITILSEDTPHFIKISQSQFFAFTGDKGFFDQIKKELVYQDHGYDLIDLVHTYHARISKIPYEKAPIFITIGGLDDKRDMQVFAFSNENHADKSWLHYTPKENDLCCTFMESSQNIDQKSHQKITEKFKSYLGKYGTNTANKASRAQHDLNAYVASIDSTVNKKTFQFTIKK
ncbi:hypothetical protein GMB86_14940 [Terrilactibacillus sp. BCM23-1]|uniref:Uncharacterized protein n=1 Tax=Terrilactibacillus tamarindi TaxID=2599694 RepID=A0A6N8CT18_9BACI|nr:hypothetical protein [Terrilactibacillus tamarindi]MTT33294.1 hypothetical protein [Terrilactibacillus tamarindi]